MDVISYLFFFILIAGLLALGGLLLRGYLTTGNPADGLNMAAFFGPKPERRLDVVDQANVDGRRRLILIRRDDVEHLIMTGGPVDVVIETGISVGGTARASVEAADPPPPSSARRARSAPRSANPSPSRRSAAPFPQGLSASCSISCVAPWRVSSPSSSR